MKNDYFEAMNAMNKMAESINVIQQLEDAAKHLAICQNPLGDFIEQQQKLMAPIEEMERMYKLMNDPINDLKNTILDMTAPLFEMQSAFSKQFEEMNRSLSASIQNLPISLDDFPTVRQIEVPQIPKMRIFANTFVEQVTQSIEETVNELEEGQQLVVLYVTATGETIFVRSLGYENPFFVVIHGEDIDGYYVKTVAHMNSVQFELKIINIKQGKTKPRIGFLSEDNSED